MQKRKAGTAESWWVSGVMSGWMSERVTSAEGIKDGEKEKERERAGTEGMERRKKEKAKKRKRERRVRRENEEKEEREEEGVRKINGRGEMTIKCEREEGEMK